LIDISTRNCIKIILPNESSEDTPEVYQKLNENQKKHILQFVQGKRKKTKRLLDKVQDESGWSKEDSEKFVDWFLKSQVEVFIHRIAFLTNILKSVHSLSQ